MKKKIQTFKKDLKMPKVWREDLEAIEEIIIKELSAEKYMIETDEYEYNTVNKIPKDTKTTAELRIQTYRPYITINFSQYSASIYSGDDDLKTKGAVSKILEILSRSERPLLFWFQRFSMTIAPILFVLFFKIFETISETKTILFWITSGILIAIVICCIVSFYISTNKFSCVQFIYKKERLNFFRRNQDQIVLLIFGAIIGAIFTKLFGS